MPLEINGQLPPIPNNNYLQQPIEFLVEPMLIPVRGVARILSAVTQLAKEVFLNTPVAQAIWNPASLVTRILPQAGFFRGVTEMIPIFGQLVSSTEN